MRYANQRRHILRRVLMLQRTTVWRIGSFLILVALSYVSFAAEPATMNLWPDKPPGETKELPREADQTKPEDKLIAGRRIIKLGNVSVPQITIYRPEGRASGASVVICPGGGHNILAYDLEGT